MASIKPHGQGWKVQVSVRDPQTGKYRVVSKQVNGNKREAQRVARDMETAKETGRLKPGQSPTLADYAGLWLEGRKHQLAHNTYRGYLTNIKNHINPYLGSVKIRDLSVAAVRAWISRLRDAGYAPRTIQYARVNLNMVMAAALDEGLIATNPVSKVGSPKLERREMEILDEAQVRRLVEGAAKTRLIAPIVFGVMCGLRRGEICGLRWQDIDLDRGELAVIQTLQRVKGSGLTVQPPKSAGSRRPIALPQSAVRYLRHWRARQAEDKLAAGPAWRNGDYVCTTLDGGPLEPSELNRAFGKLIIELGLPHITLHGMRHTYASLALRAGVDIKRVQASLGHATAAFTLDVYGHVTASGLKDAAATFDRAVFGDTILDRF